MLKPTHVTEWGDNVFPTVNTFKVLNTKLIFLAEAMPSSSWLEFECDLRYFL